MSGSLYVLTITRAFCRSASRVTLLPAVGQHTVELTFAGLAREHLSQGRHSTLIVRLRRGTGVDTPRGGGRHAQILPRLCPNCGRTAAENWKRSGVSIPDA